MIVRKDKSFNKMGMYPDTDWIGDADWVLNDNDPKDAEIEEKIISLYPNYDFVLDDDGNIADVTATEPAEKLPEITLEQRVTATENAVEELISMIMGG